MPTATKWRPSRDLVRTLLRHPHDHDWSWQGFGMFRLLLSESGDVRLHVWVPETATSGVHTIHTHPWDFESKVIQGAITNKKYRKFSLDLHPPHTHQKQPILCGVGGGLDGRWTGINLTADNSREGVTYQAGESYAMAHDEIHESIPTPGCITVVRRLFRADREKAFVFVPTGETWVSAEPRKATRAEINAMADLALSVEE